MYGMKRDIKLRFTLGSGSQEKIWVCSTYWSGMGYFWCKLLPDYWKNHSLSWYFKLETGTIHVQKIFFLSSKRRLHLNAVHSKIPIIQFCPKRVKPKVLSHDIMEYWVLSHKVIDAWTTTIFDSSVSWISLNCRTFNK